MADPVGYRSPAERRPERAPPILLNAETAAQFLTWSQAEKKNSPKWVHEQKVYLAWWQEVLGSVNLRELRVERLLEALNGTKCRTPKGKDLSATVTEKADNALAKHEVFSYRAKERVAVEAYFRNPGTAPWTAAGAVLILWDAERQRTVALGNVTFPE